MAVDYYLGWQTADIKLFFNKTIVKEHGKCEVIFRKVFLNPHREVGTGVGFSGINGQDHYGGIVLVLITNFLHGRERG